MKSNPAPAEVHLLPFSHNEPFRGGWPITLARSLQWTFVLAVGLCLTHAEESAMTHSLSLLPKPIQMATAPGTFEVNRQTTLVAGPGTEAEASKLAAALRMPTGFALPRKQDVPNQNGLVLQLDRALEPQLGQEGYRLSVQSNRVTIRAAAEAGLFYGGVTFRQLLPPEIFVANQPAQPPANSWRAPLVEIEDTPRFPWRGLLADPARHFLPLEFLKKLVDVMALHKLNTLQLHLTDDQGWRIEIKKYPRLTQIGSVRKESPRPGDRNRGDGTPYGPFFYTQDQLRDLVAYAQARHVTILPEIEMPGHFLAALAAYPEFSCTGGPFELRTRWGIEKDILCPGNDGAVAFARDILEELIAVFPSRFIHIGGDEAPRDRWKTCPKCQARIKAEGLKNEAQLQTWLNHRIEEFLVSKGRRLIGWDEILEGGLTPGATVMSWRGTTGGIAAAEAGHDVVMSPTSHCYFDYAQAKGPTEPESIGGFIPLEKVYAFEPMPSQLQAEKRRHILGAQGNVWGEYLWTPKDFEYFAFPRAAALAEVVWSSADSRDFSDFRQRLPRHLARLRVLGVNYRRDPAFEARQPGDPIKAFCIDFNWGEGGPNGFAKPGLWADASPEEHVAWYAALGCNVIQTFAVSCNGYAWYKGGQVPSQPGLKHDFLADTVKLGHQRGLKVMGYFCVGANTLWGETHPSLSYGAPSAPHIPFTTEYLDYLCASIEEALRLTGMDGFMIDWVWTPGDLDGTRLRWLDCELQMYRELFGEPFPGQDKISPDRELEFRRRAVDRCWERIRATTRRVKPDAVIWLSCCNVSAPVVTNSRLFQEVDWLMNEATDPKSLDQVKGMKGPHTRLVQCVVGWGDAHDARKILGNTADRNLGLYGFAKPNPNSLPLPVAEYRRRPIASFQGNDRNIAVLARHFTGTPLDAVEVKEFVTKVPGDSRPLEILSREFSPDQREATVIFRSGMGIFACNLDFSGTPLTKLRLVVRNEKFCEGLDFQTKAGRNIELRRADGVRIAQRGDDLVIEIVPPTLNALKEPGRLQFINQYR